MLLSCLPLAGFSVLGVLYMVLSHQISQSQSLGHDIDPNAFYIDYPATRLTTFSSWTSTIATTLAQTAMAALVSLPIYRTLWQGRDEVTLTYDQISQLTAMPGDGWFAWLRDRSYLPWVHSSSHGIVRWSVNILGAVWVVCFLLG